MRLWRRQRRRRRWQRRVPRRLIRAAAVPAVSRPQIWGSCRQSSRVGGSCMQEPGGGPPSRSGSRGSGGGARDGVRVVGFRAAPAPAAAGYRSSTGRRRRCHGGDNREGGQRYILCTRRHSIPAATDGIITLLQQPPAGIRVVLNAATMLNCYSCSSRSGCLASRSCRRRRPHGRCRHLCQQPPHVANVRAQPRILCRHLCRRCGVHPPLSHATSVSSRTFYHVCHVLDIRATHPSPTA